MVYVDSNESCKSFVELYDKYYNKIFNYIYKSVLNKETAEDITSNTFLKALNNIKEKNPKIGNFNAWIYKIATNEVLMHHRYMKDKKTFSIDDEEMQLHNLLESKHANKIDKYIDFISVKNAMKNLKPIENIIINMYFFENKDYAEISGILNINSSTLRSKLHRILKKLNKLLD